MKQTKLKSLKNRTKIMVVMEDMVVVEVEVEVVDTEEVAVAEVVVIEEAVVDTNLMGTSMMMVETITQVVEAENLSDCQIL